MNIEKLLKQVDCHFMFGVSHKYTSASTPDVEKYHIWDEMKDSCLLFDNEQQILAMIIDKHLEIIRCIRELS